MTVSSYSDEWCKAGTEGFSQFIITSVRQYGYPNAVL